MAYHIYTTKGIVLSSRPSREADKMYSILTEDLGLVHARAGGVRLEKSKLRGFLEPYALVNVSLVRGKAEWRLTSAELVETFPLSLHIARPLALIERLIVGEEVHPEIFQIARDFLGNPKLDTDAETRFVAHVLFELGYMREEDLALSGKELIQAVNLGLRTSHLV